MAMLLPYDVPTNIMKIEQDQSTSGDIAPDLSHLLKCKPLYRQDESLYTEAYSKMIQLEEASQSVFLVQFNQQNIKLTYSGEERQFLIENEVSSEFI